MFVEKFLEEKNILYDAEKICPVNSPVRASKFVYFAHDIKMLFLKKLCQT
jgi:hypothetical protein